MECLMVAGKGFEIIEVPSLQHASDVTVCSGTQELCDDVCERLATSDFASIDRIAPRVVVDCV